MATRKPTQADLEGRRRLRESAARLRALAERAQAELDEHRRTLGLPVEPAPRVPLRETPAERAEARARMRRHAAQLRALAEKAQAELDRRRPGAA